MSRTKTVVLVLALTATALVVGFMWLVNELGRREQTFS